ncbi:uncharacterized protein LOC119093676 [Pollicipes pollicipes]|uniref:uncharacterized protein LOC119093676 n=1 Tax=Pollicipes pollicipes TaxID=41117 RepID=UPI0018856B66|nr:uncharacterized protein LOC119093676 [Pollicipes pollicipes]
MTTCRSLTLLGALALVAVASTAALPATTAGQDLPPRVDGAGATGANASEAQQAEQEAMEVSGRGAPVDEVPAERVEEVPAERVEEVPADGVVVVPPAPVAAVSVVNVDGVPEAVKIATSAALASAAGEAAPDASAPDTVALREEPAQAGASKTDMKRPAAQEATAGQGVGNVTVVMQTSSVDNSAELNARRMPVAAPVCAAILDRLAYDSFRRQHHASWTMCRCLNRAQAVCRPETQYPTVRPGSASAVLGLEHAGAVSSAQAQAEAAANLFAMRHSCGQQVQAGRICFFSIWRGQPTCDCAERLALQALEAGVVTRRARPAAGAQNSPGETQEAVPPLETQREAEHAAPPVQARNFNDVQEFMRF